MITEIPDGLTTEKLLQLDKRADRLRRVIRLNERKTTNMLLVLQIDGAFYSYDGLGQRVKMPIIGDGKPIPVL